MAVVGGIRTPGGRRGTNHVAGSRQALFTAYTTEVGEGIGKAEPYAGRRDEDKAH